MSASLGLLLVLQCLWIFNSYETAFYTFRRMVNGQFQNAVGATRDSVLLRHLVKLPSPDSISRVEVVKDTVFGGGRIDIKRRTGMSLFITSTGNNDSLRKALGPIVGKLQASNTQTANFTIRIGQDTISRDSLRQSFNRLLAHQPEGKLPFLLKRTTQPPTDLPWVRLRKPRQNNQPRFSTAEILADTVKTEWIHTDSLHQYAAHFYNVRWHLLKEISPQIFFAVFLLALTGMSFLLMYRSLRAQQKLMELKNDFISNVTHELKTPVTTVSVALEALRNFKGLESRARTEEYLDIAQSELNRLTILTDKILKTAIFENRGVNFESEPVDLFKTLEQVLHSMKLVFEKQKAKVTFEKTGEAFTISGGSVHITNVIYNLLDNALKYSEGEPQISISLTAQADKVVLRVSDKGIGIPKEYSKKIFEKFFRVPSGDVHNVKGYGLGLSYVESVIRSHHGHIEVESDSGQGSTFVISLPRMVG